MEVSIKRFNQHTIVAIVGSLDLYNVGSLKKRVQSILEDGEVGSLVIDLKDLEYMDSSGIALMAHMRKKMLKKNSKFILLRPGEEVLQVMRLAALEQFFTFAHSEEEL